MPSPDDLYRAAIARLNALAADELAQSFATLEGASRPAVALVLSDEILPSVMDRYGSAAASFSADWYEETRAAAKVPGKFRVSPAQLPDLGRTSSLAWWGTEPVLKGDYAGSLSRVQGGMQRIVANAGRATISGAAVADPGARGWQRVGVGHNCPFCEMLIARGAVYTEATVDFASHDHCNCAAMPAWVNASLPVKPYEPTSRRITDADRARVREYLRTH